MTRHGAPGTRGHAAVGVDIGGTSTRVGLVAERGELLALRCAPTPRDGDPAAVVNLLRTLLRQAVADCRARDTGCEPTARVRAVARASVPADPQGAPVQVHAPAGPVGVALPGYWDRRTQVMQRAVNLPKLEGLDLRKLLVRALGRCDRLESDVNAAAWAQWRALARAAGRAPDRRARRAVPPRRAPVADAGLAPGPGPRFVYLSIGTGIGGAVIFDGNILRHTRGGAGHLGHLCVDSTRTAPRCRCGQRGCAEAVVRAAAAQGDLAAAAGALARLVMQVVHLYAPDVVCLGGGIPDHHGQLVRRVREVLRTRRSSLAPPRLRVVRAPLDADRAAVVGVARLAAWDRA